MYPDPQYPGQPQQPGQDPYGQQQYPPTTGYPAQPQQGGYPQQPVSGQPAYPPQPVSGQPAYAPQPYGQPTQAQPPAYQPTPDPTSAWGNQPVSTGPMGTTPVSPAYTGTPGAYPPAETKKSKKNLIMGIVNAVLVLALLGIGAYVLTTTGGLRDDVASLKEQKAAAEKVESDRQQALKDEFEKADLRGKLAKVRELTTASTRALTNWADNRETVPIRTVQEAINKCNEAVFEYDATAAKFPADMLGDLPARIATTATTTNCGRLN